MVTTGSSALAIIHGKQKPTTTKGRDIRIHVLRTEKVYKIDGSDEMNDGKVCGIMIASLAYKTIVESKAGKIQLKIVANYSVETFSTDT
jgi:hypothetical protein